MSSLQRYVSSELTHFVGRSLPTDDEKYSLLVKIVKTGQLQQPCFQSRSVITMLETGGEELSGNQRFVVNAVCFCDIPVDDLHLHIKKYSAFGLSFLKSLLVLKGANPVFYIASDSAIKQLDGPWTNRAKHFDRMYRVFRGFFDSIFELIGKGEIEVAKGEIYELQRWLNKDFLSFIKFFDSSKPDEDIDNYYMEREWRVLGPVQFSLQDVRRIILPSGYAQRLREDVPEFCGQVTFVNDSIL